MSNNNGSQKWMLPLDVNVSDIDESSNITAEQKNNIQHTHFGGNENGRTRQWRWGEETEGERGRCMSSDA